MTRQVVVEHLADITENDILEGYEEGSVFVLSPTSPDRALFRFEGRFPIKAGSKLAIEMCSEESA